MAQPVAGTVEAAQGGGAQDESGAPCALGAAPASLPCPAVTAPSPPSVYASPTSFLDSQPCTNTSYGAAASSAPSFLSKGSDFPQVRAAALIWGPGIAGRTGQQAGRGAATGTGVVGSPTGQLWGASPQPSSSVTARPRLTAKAAGAGPVQPQDLGGEKGEAEGPSQLALRWGGDLAAPGAALPLHGEHRHHLRPGGSNCTASSSTQTGQGAVPWPGTSCLVRTASGCCITWKAPDWETLRCSSGSEASFRPPGFH